MELSRALRWGASPSSRLAARKVNMIVQDAKGNFRISKVRREILKMQIETLKKTLEWKESEMVSQIPGVRKKNIAAQTITISVANYYHIL